MSETSGTNKRLTRVESKVRLARQDAAVARELAAGADRDVSVMRDELRSHTRTLNALRETQVEQGTAIRELRGEVREGFSRIAVGQAQITALLSNQLEDSGEASSD